MNNDEHKTIGALVVVMVAKMVAGIVGIIREVLGGLLWRRRVCSVVLMGWCAVMLMSCRGYFADKPPIDLVPNLDDQPKERAQSESRKLPEGVVPHTLTGGRTVGAEVDFSARAIYGIDITGDYIAPEDVETYAVASVNQTPLPFGIGYTEAVPYDVDRDFVMRGMGRFNIYCSVCHARTGTGDSIIMRRGVGLPRPPDLSSETIVQMTDGELYNVITHGRRNMRGYATQIPVADRWAIVSYVRALQYARNGQIGDVPDEKRAVLVAELEAAAENQSVAAAEEVPAVAEPTATDTAPTTTPGVDESQ
ncbi:hypothetical protein COTS27_01663 [Spirochaetota bacterium]|nr:hypothetical protein COTS27_01663 [Spirochaetota bacterium]